MLTSWLTNVSEVKSEWGAILKSLWITSKHNNLARRVLFAATWQLEWFFFFFINENDNSVTWGETFVFQSWSDWCLLLRLRRGYKNMRATEVNMLFCKFPNDDWVVARRSLEKRETSCDCDFFHTLPKIKNIENGNNNNRLWGQNLEWD